MIAKIKRVQIDLDYLR